MKDRRARIGWRSKAAYSLVVLLIALVAIELGARVAFLSVRSLDCSGDSSGWQTKFFRDLFEWHESDPDLLWRFEPNLNTAYLATDADGLVIGDEPVPQQADTVTLLLLGDSSPVGLGLASYRQSFGALLQDSLQARCGEDTAVRVVNASVSGYSSEQALRWLRLRGERYAPDIVLTYLGNNDASISGVRSDRELIGAQRATGLRRQLGRSAAYRLLCLILIPPAHQSEEAAERLVCRVKPSGYAQNLCGIAEWCRVHSCPLIVIKPAVPLLWPAGLQFKVFSDTRGEDGELILPEPMRRILGREVRYCFDWEEIRRRYGAGDRFTRAVFNCGFIDTVSAAQAVARYSERTREEPEDCLAWHNLGVAQWERRFRREAVEVLGAARTCWVKRNDSQRGLPAIAAAGSVYSYNLGVSLLYTPEADTTLALRHLDSALQSDFFSLRVKREYLAAIDSLGLAAPDVHVVDATDVFRLERGSILGTEDLFIDHCHPKAEGHALIARALTRVCREALD